MVLDFPRFFYGSQPFCQPATNKTFLSPVPQTVHPRLRSDVEDFFLFVIKEIRYFVIRIQCRRKKLTIWPVPLTILLKQLICFCKRTTVSWLREAYGQNGEEKIYIIFIEQFFNPLPICLYLPSSHFSINFCHISGWVSFKPKTQHYEKKQQPPKCGLIA